MKQTKLWLITIAALLCSITASAHDFEVDGIYYKIASSTDLTVSVTFKGSISDYYPEYFGSITIPATVTHEGVNYSVTSIGNYAFYSCSNLTSITIPESVTSIGVSAFAGCFSLTSITIPEGMTSIGDRAFASCHNLRSITIPEGVTSIGEEAFDSCGNLTSITIPKSVTSIGNRAFYYCDALTSITISEGVMSIGDRAFCYCEALRSITIPKSVTSIGMETFYYCKSLTSITIPNGSKLTGIGRSAFYKCSSLTSITLPEGVTSIGEMAFCDCSSLTSITIPESVTSIGEGAFSGTAWYENKPDGMVYAGKVLYKYKGSMPKNSSITIKEGTKSIVAQAFEDCGNLTSITIPEGVTSIGNYTFGACSSLTSIIIPESVTSIGSSAFYGCSSLTSITIPESVTSIGEGAFDRCSSLTSITIPNGSKLTSIGFGAFQYCSSLTSITIPESVTSIGHNAFEYCSSLTSITIPEGVTSIGEEAFEYCGNLTSITIPKSVTSIGNRAFYYCDALTSITISEGVTSIGDRAFAGCTNLSTITSCSVIPPVCGTQALDDINKQTCTLRVPIGYAAAYQTADQWKEFLFIEDVVEVEKYTLTFMVDGEVYQTFSLPCNVEVTIPDAPTKEGYTFSGWDEVPATMPANDVTISGFFTPNMYKVYYYVDEELVHTAEVVYGEAIPKYIYEPMVKGEVFVGWIGETYETMPAHDVTYKAEIDIISINLTIDQYGSGTFCSMHALDFSEVAGLKAYVATGYNTETGVVTLTRVMTAKPGEGLFLKGNPGDYEVVTMKDSESCMQNLLVGALEDTIVNSTSEDGFSANYEYIIKGYDTTPVFYGVVNGSVQKGGKAYLQLPKEWIATGMTRAIGLRFDDEEIEFSDEEQPATPAVIHDLQGRRVTTPSNGTFIVNGKKVVFK